MPKVINPDIASRRASIQNLLVGIDQIGGAATVSPPTILTPNPDVQPFIDSHALDEAADLQAVMMAMSNKIAVLATEIAALPLLVDLP